MNTADLIRQRFEKVNSQYVNTSGGKVYAEPSKLRIETPLEAGIGSYTFDVKKTDIRNRREVALDRNDVFIPNFLGLFISLQPTANPSTEILSSFPLYNDGVKPSPYVAGFQNKDIEALYNGKFTWTIDNGVLLSSYPTERFRKVPETQSAFVLDSNDSAVAEQILPEWDILKACDLLIPRFLIAGTRDHQITVHFDSAGLTFPVTTGYKPYLVL